MTATSHESRRITRVVDARPLLGGALMRVLGSTDFKGQGTEFPISDLGPFILVDDARGIDGPGHPTFGAHPHAGLVAISYVAGGGAWRSRSNAPGFEDLEVEPGGVLVTSAGRGVVHDERTATDGAHEMTQIILRLPKARREIAASITKRTPVRVADGVLRLFDPASLADLGLDAAVYHCTLPAGGRAEITPPPGHEAAFVYARTGAVHVAGERLEPGRVAVLGGDAAIVALSAPPEAPSDCIVGTGALTDEPWAKLLGNNGFVVGADERAAEALMTAYEEAGGTFGHAPRE